MPGAGGGGMDEMNARVSMGFVNGIISGCFKACVTDFSSDTLSMEEMQCLRGCGGRESKALMILSE